MERPVINYIYDPLCSWCFGFSPVISKLYKRHKANIDFRVLTGGMVLGEQEGPIGNLPKAVKEGFATIEETTGVTFGQDFKTNLLVPGTAQLTSLPGALAMATFRIYQPDNTVPFAARIQQAIYKEGLAPAEAKTYGHCAEDFGMNSTDFMKLMVAKDKLEIVKKEFEVVKQWGIRGFPTVVYQKGDKGQILSRGYMPLEKIEENLKIVQEQF